MTDQAAGSMPSTAIVVATTGPPATSATTGVLATSATSPSSAPPAAVTVVTWPGALLDCRDGLSTGMIADHFVAPDANPMPVDSPLDPATAVLADMGDVIAEGDPAVVLEIIEQGAGTARVLGRSGDRVVLTMALSVRGGHWTPDTADACYEGEVGTQVPPPIPLTETLPIDTRSTFEPPADGVPAVDVPALLAVARPMFDRRTAVHALLYGTYVRTADGDEPAVSVPAISFAAREACAPAAPAPGPPPTVPSPPTTSPPRCTHHVIVELEGSTIVADWVMEEQPS